MRQSSHIANRSVAYESLNSPGTRLRGQFLRILLADAELLVLTVKRTYYDDGRIELAIAHGNPDDLHPSCIMFVMFERTAVALVTSLTVNKFAVRHDYFLNEDYIEDHWLQSPYPKAQLKKDGWCAYGNKNCEWYKSPACPEFKLAGFKDWIE